MLLKVGAPLAAGVNELQVEELVVDTEVEVAIVLVIDEDRGVEVLRVLVLVVAVDLTLIGLVVKTTDVEVLLGVVTATI